MGSFREIEARFNKYLSQPEENTEDAREYQKIFNKIHDVLSMRKERLAADNVLRQVVDLLTAASSNPLDGGVSDALCQAIYTAWQAKTNGKNKGKMMDAMEREIRTNTQKMSLMESGVTTSSGSASNQKGGKKGNSDSNPARDNPRYKYLEKRVVEMQARKLKLETEQVLTVTEPKSCSSPHSFSCLPSAVLTMCPSVAACTAACSMTAIRNCAWRRGPMPPRCSEVRWAYPLPCLSWTIFPGNWRGIRTAT